MIRSSVPLEAYIDQLRRLPPPAVRKIVLPYDDTFMTCACGFRRPKAQMPSVNSGVVAFRSDQCTACVRKYKDLARVVCVTCREVVGMVEPSKDPEDHFTFERGGLYHVMNCDVCMPGVQSSEVIERILWRRSHNIPNPLKSTS